MGKNEEDAVDRPLQKEIKSKKSKNVANDLLDVGEGDSHIEASVGLPKNKDHKHKEKKQRSNEDEDLHSSKDKFEDDGDSQKKDKKRKRHSSKMVQENENEQGQDDESDIDGDHEPKPRKEKNKKKKKHKHHSREMELENDGVGISEGENVTDGQNIDAEMNRTMTDNPSKEGSAMEDGNGSKSKDKGKKKMKSVENNMEAKKDKSKKKVNFSSHVEVFPSSETNSKKQKTNKDGLVRGKRFTLEEDEIVKTAVFNYITARGLGDEGLKMVLNCSSHRGMKKCWQEIGTCIPYRPYTAVYYRAHILFERAENRSWTPKEIKLLKEFHEKNGNQWKVLAEELGKHRFHVKDTWRRVKFKDLKKGRWSQEEYQSLYDMVNLDLQMKVTGQDKKSKHGMLRDNIPWTAISEKLSTRTDATCCRKWYEQLTSSLVAENKWADSDDYRLIGALYELDAVCVEDVDWDSLLEHRPGDICRKRWDQMVLHIGHRGSKPFIEQVEMLAKRYRPDLAEIREAWDQKPVVP